MLLLLKSSRRVEPFAQEQQQKCLIFKTNSADKSPLSQSDQAGLKVFLFIMF